MAAAFPTDISCAITEGFQEQLPSATRYLGGKSVVNPSRGKVKVIFTSHADFETFMRWYITDINYGLDSFTITVPFFGVSRAWEVKILTELDTAPNAKASYIREIQMDLEIIDNIDDYIAT